MLSELKHLSEKEIKALQELKKRLKDTFGKELKEIRIFGSKVRGDFDSESDIDIFLVFDRKVDWEFENKVFGLAYELDLEFGVLFNIVIFSSESLREHKYKILPFVKSVKKEGVKI
jgi:predicted nucleotidyltransferase